MVRDPSGRRKDDCFFSTDPKASVQEIQGRVSARWPLDVTLRDAKQCLGLEDPQNRVAKATQRTAPMALFGYSLVVIWFANHGSFDLKRYQEEHPWYRQKRVPSFADMLESLRVESLQRSISSDLSNHAGSPEIARPVRPAVARTRRRRA